MAELLIGELARRAGVSTSAIRFYEREKLLPRPGRSSGRRVYGLVAVEQLRMIDLAKRAGFTIPEIRMLLRGFSSSASPGTRWRAMAQKKLPELNMRIEEAENMKVVLEAMCRCDSPTFDDCAKALREHSPSVW